MRTLKNVAVPTSQARTFVTAKPSIPKDNVARSFSTTATNFAKPEMNTVAQESNIPRVVGNNYNGSFGGIRSSSLVGRHSGIQINPIGVRSFSTGRAAEVAAPTDKV